LRLNWRLPWYAALSMIAIGSLVEVALLASVKVMLTGLKSIPDISHEEPVPAQRAKGADHNVGSGSQPLIRS
jgi:hypothetical protein